MMSCRDIASSSGQPSVNAVNWCRRFGQRLESSGGSAPRGRCQPSRLRPNTLPTSARCFDISDTDLQVPFTLFATTDECRSALTVIAAAAAVVGWSTVAVPSCSPIRIVWLRNVSGLLLRQWGAGAAGRRLRRDSSSTRKGEPAAGPAQVSIGIARANIRPSRCDCRRTQKGGAAPSLRRTASRCSAPASPSGDMFRRSTGNMATAAHGCRPAWKRPLVECSPGAASLRARSDPGSQYRQDLRPADLHQIGAQAAGIIAGRNQPQHPSHLRSPSRLSTRPNRTSRGAIPHSLDTPIALSLG